MSGSRFIAVLFVLSALIFSFFVLGVNASEVEDAAVLAVDTAGEAVVGAYRAVLEAEQVGANVSGLVKMLNVAGEHLAKANMCLRLGDFDSAIENADLCSGIAGGVEADAGELKKLVPQERRQHFLLSVIGSMIAMGLIGVGGVISWYVFKGRYYRRILEMKHKVDERGV